jgi:uncharacterized integral membrane protein
MELRRILILIGILLLLVLCLQNVQVVTIRFLFWEISMSLVVMLLIAILIGFAIGFLVRPTISKSRS